MIAIADSGSTKTEWCLVDERGRIHSRCFTPGMNPYFQSEGNMAETVRQVLYPQWEGYSVDAVYFYGAGCAFPEKNALVEKAIRSCWPVPVEVNSDLMAAARALCGTETGIACILGTGANSCLYDGREVKEQVSPLGFILGDEGSGAVLGRTLVGDCLKRQLPDSLCREFMETYRLTPASVLEHVYKMPFPNRYLAGFVPFLKEHLDAEPVYRLVYRGFEDFIRRNVMQYTGYDRHPVHFAGSVAFGFRQVLRQVIGQYGLSPGKIEKAPMDGLVAYHNKERGCPAREAAASSRRERGV